MNVEAVRPDERVRVTQKIRTREGVWTTQIEGRVVSYGMAPTGSWFAHGKNDKLWLRRLRLERDDGEITDLVLDEETVVTPLTKPSGKY